MPATGFKSQALVPSNSKPVTFIINYNKILLSFQNIEFLYGLGLLFPLVVLLCVVIRWKRITRQALGSKKLINQLTKGYSEEKYIIKVMIIIVSIGLLIITAANLRKPIKEKGTAGTGIDIMIALDVSKSMLAEDEKPTRLDKAKELIYKLTAQLQDNHIGLVVFAGKAYLQMPLTSDIGAIKMFVSNANPALIGWQGTIIGDALLTCDNNLDTKEKKYKAAILITDGEGQDTKALDAAKKLTEKGVIVHTVGVGSVAGAPIIEGTNDYKKDAEGNTVITKLNSILLQQIADATGGTYHYLDNTDVVSNDLSQTLNSMDKKAIGSPGSYVEYESYYFIFLTIAIILLVVELFITEKTRKVFIDKTLVTAAMLLLYSSSAVCQSSNSTIIKGNEFYRKGDFKSAQVEYEKVLGQDSKSAIAAFNNANSLFRQQQYAAAAKQMEELAANTADPIFRAKAWYNKGVAEVRQQQMVAAAVAFKKSLVLNSNDEATKENLQMVLNELRKKQQEDQQNKNKSQPEQKKQTSTKQAEQQLNMLRDEEKRLQQEVQQKKFKQQAGNEKDW